MKKLYMRTWLYWIRYSIVWVHSIMVSSAGSRQQLTAELRPAGRVRRRHTSISPTSRRHPRAPPSCLFSYSSVLLAADASRRPPAPPGHTAALPISTSPITTPRRLLAGYTIYANWPLLWGYATACGALHWPEVSSAPPPEPPSALPPLARDRQHTHTVNDDLMLMYTTCPQCMCLPGWLSSAGLCRYCHTQHSELTESIGTPVHAHIHGHTQKVSIS